MLKKLTINNFQSWKKTTIKWHKGVNVIIGKSDKGKSALFRSMYFLIKNRPLGDGFISWEADKVRVDLSLSTRPNAY